MNAVFFSFLFSLSWCWGQSLPLHLQLPPPKPGVLKVDPMATLRAAQRDLEENRKKLEQYQKMPISQWPDSKFKLLKIESMGGNNGGGGDDTCASFSALFFDLGLAIWETREQLKSVPLGVRNLLRPFFFHRVYQMQCLPMEKKEGILTADENSFFLNQAAWEPLNIQTKTLIVMRLVLQALDTHHGWTQFEVEAIYDELRERSHRMQSYRVAENVVRESDRVSYRQPGIYLDQWYSLGHQRFITKTPSFYQEVFVEEPYSGEQVAQDFCRWLGHKSVLYAFWSEPVFTLLTNVPVEDFISKVPRMAVISVSPERELEVLRPSHGGADLSWTRTLKSVSCLR